MTLLFDSSTPTLAIPQSIHQQAWLDSRDIPMPGLRLQSYLNQVCLHTLRPWLADCTGATVAIASPVNPHLWAMVNGCAVTLDELRLILIPTEAMDRDEFRIPQEWVDLPSWAGDYYLAVEVDPDQQAIALWGYTTHAQIKAQAELDESDRSYGLEGLSLIPDLSVLWVMRQIGTEPTRAPLLPLSPLPSTQAQALLQRVAQTCLPRLELPFSAWGALLEQPQWRQQLAPESSTPRLDASLGVAMTHLTQWLQEQFEAGWQTMDALFQADATLAVNFRRDDATDPLIRRAKWIQLGETTIRWVVMIGPEADGRLRILMQVFPDASTPYLSPQLSVTLSSTTGDRIQSVQASNTSNSLRLRPFRCPPNTLFQAEFRLGEAVTIERFRT